MAKRVATRTNSSLFAVTRFARSGSATSGTSPRSSGFASAFELSESVYAGARAAPAARARPRLPRLGRARRPPRDGGRAGAELRTGYGRLSPGRRASRERVLPRRRTDLPAGDGRRVADAVARRRRGARPPRGVAPRAALADRLADVR